MRTLRLVGHRHHDINVCVSGVGDEDFVAVQDIVVACIDCRGLLCRSIRTGVGLRKAESAEPFARAELGQVFHFLFFGTVLINRSGAERRVCRYDHARSGAYARQLFDGHRIKDVVAACTAVVDGEGNTEDSQFCHFLYGFHRETFLFVDFGSQRFHLVFGKFADHLPEQLLGFGQFEIHFISMVFNDFKQSYLHLRSKRHH